MVGLDMVTSNIIWLSAHLAVIETIFRIYSDNQITSKCLAEALSLLLFYAALFLLSTVVGCRVNYQTLKNISGADGALLWLVSVAARAITILGIKNCSDWLKYHLLNDVVNRTAYNVEDSETKMSNKLFKQSDSADQFLQGLSMSNLAALAFHFYCPELAPFEDFLFHFTESGDSDPASSQHNARLTASICQTHFPNLFAFLFLMPESCLPNERSSINTCLNTMNLLGFCSQGLARLSTHRRLEYAAIAVELFVCFSQIRPDREISNLKSNQLELNDLPIYRLSLSSSSSLNKDCMLRDQANPFDSNFPSSWSSSRSSRATYRLNKEQSTQLYNNFRQLESSENVNRQSDASKQETLKHVANESDKYQQNDAVKTKKWNPLEMMFQPNNINPNLINGNSKTTTEVRLETEFPISPLPTERHKPDVLTFGNSPIRSPESDVVSNSETYSPTAISTHQPVANKENVVDQSQPIMEPTCHPNLSRGQSLYSKRLHRRSRKSPAHLKLSTTDDQCPDEDNDERRHFANSSCFKFKASSPLFKEAPRHDYSRREKHAYRPRHSSSHCCSHRQHPLVYPVLNSTPYCGCIGPSKVNHVIMPGSIITHQCCPVQMGESVNPCHMICQHQTVSKVDVPTQYSDTNGQENDKQKAEKAEHQVEPIAKEDVLLQSERANHANSHSAITSDRSVSSTQKPSHLLAESYFISFHNNFCNTNEPQITHYPTDLNSARTNRHFPKIAKSKYKLGKPNSFDDNLNYSPDCHTLSSNRKCSEPTESTLDAPQLPISDVTRQKPLRYGKDEKITDRKLSLPLEHEHVSENFLKTNCSRFLPNRKGDLISKRSISVTRPKKCKVSDILNNKSNCAQDDLSTLAIQDYKSSFKLPPVELKLFVQLETKSNRRVISNSLNHCCLAGPVNEELKRVALEALGCSDGKHFIILLKSHCQYKGLYNYVAQIDKALKISGSGPSKINHNMVAKFYKYDSGSKRFQQIDSTSHLSTVVDAITLYGIKKTTKSYALPTISSSGCPVHGMV